MTSVTRGWRLGRARGRVALAPATQLPALPLTAGHHAPASPPPGEPRLSRGQRVRRFGRDLVVDRVTGRVGIRTAGSGGARRMVVFAETVDALVDVLARADGGAGADRGAGLGPGGGAGQGAGYGAGLGAGGGAGPGPGADGGGALRAGADGGGTVGVRPGGVRRITVVVGWWTAPWRGWTGRPGALADVVRQRVRFPASGRGRVTVDLTLARPAPLPDVLGAVLFAVRPATPIPGAPGPRSLPEGRATGVTDPDEDPDEVAGGSGVREAGVAGVRAAVALVDERRFNPRGRRVESYRSDAPRFALELGPAPASTSTVDEFDPSAVTFSGRNAPPWEWPGASRWRRGVGAGLAWPTVTALRSVGIVECGHVSTDDPASAASLLARLAATGVVLHAPGLGGAVGDLLAPELRAVLAEPLPAPEIGPLGMEIRSVRQRRAALRGHSVQFGQSWVPAVSAILATKREEHLPAILRAIAGQTYPSLEIVLCLHGIELPEECRDFLRHCGRPVQIVPVAAEVSFGVALGLATARAGGTLVTKFDDDDTYGPEHVWDLVLARGFSGATLVGKGIEFVHLETADVTVRRRSGRPESDTDVVAGGTMLIARGELEQLGGWRPVPRSVDRGLLDRVNRAGGLIYRTHPLGYLYHRRGGGHTWAASDEYFLRGARQRWDGLPRLAEFGTAERP